MMNNPGSHLSSLGLDVRQRWALCRLRINSLDHGKAIFAYPGQNTDGPQESRCIIDQVEKGRHREHLYVRRPALPSVSELIKSGLFFGETTSYEVFLFSSQESLQNFSVSFDVRLVHEQEVIPRV